MLFEKINLDIKSAMKSGEKEKLMTLRAIKSELLLLKTSGKAQSVISEKESIKLLQKMVKQRKDTAIIYKNQNRNDLYEKEMKEVSFIQPYLPKQMTNKELTLAVSEIIERIGAKNMKDMGKTMGLASKELSGKAEGRAIAGKVKELLMK